MKPQNSNLRTSKFQDMGISANLLSALEKMEISKPTDVQAQAIPVALNGSDIIGVAQTGSGKTLAFALPVLTALENKPEARALVMAPSREMAQQIFKVFAALTEKNPLTMALVIGGIPSAKQITSLKKNPRLVVGTPGRLNDHLVTNKLLLQSIEYVVIDEADRMLDMGFTPQLKNIQNTLRGKRQTLMFSASFNPNVEAVAKLFMGNEPIMIRALQAEAPVESLSQTILFIDKYKKNDRLLDELNITLNKNRTAGIIVFCGNQGSCERMGQYLKEYGYKTDLIHGGLSQGHRNRVVRDFREGKTQVLVATDLLARGIDIPQVEQVINFDLPFQAEDFLHRIGRTARAGRAGQSITFVTAADGKMFSKIKPYLQGAREVKLETDFAFASRSSERSENNSNRYRNKNSDPKKTFDPTRKMQGKPESKTIGNLDKPKKLSTTEKPMLWKSGTLGKSKGYSKRK
jgi:ATP-dependent RNA helicase RhlE